MTAWQITFGLLTVVMSGVVAAVVTFRLNARREDRQFRRERLEHLFRGFAGFCTLLTVDWSAQIGFMSGKLDYDQALNVTIESGKSNERHLENAEMLVAIYWPELQSHVDALKTVRDDASVVIRKHKTQYKPSCAPDTKSLEAMRQLVRRLDEVETRFGEVVRAQAANLR